VRACVFADCLSYAEPVMGYTLQSGQQQYATSIAAASPLYAYEQQQYVI